MDNFGNALKEKRESMGLSKNAIAELLGITVNTLYRWENGITIPSDEKQVKAFETLDEANKKNNESIEVFLNDPTTKKGMEKSIVIANNTMSILKSFGVKIRSATVTLNNGDETEMYCVNIPGNEHDYIINPIGMIIEMNTINEIIKADIFEYLNGEDFGKVDYNKSK